MKKRFRGFKARLVVLLIAACFLGSGFLAVIYPKITHATTPSIIINEIMYHPNPDIDANEFLELYNTTAGPIDLNGWCFTAGVALCFNSSTVIVSHGFGVVSPSAAQTLNTYGKTTIGTYTGKLDNGGENITLKDNLGITVNSVTYSDHGTWPISPDGSGPSLELKDPTLDNTLAASWGASNGAPTPAVVNSLYGVTPPVVEAVTKPSGVQPGVAQLITVQVQNASSVTLSYKAMFDTDQTIPMYDDGAHSDGASGDNVYGATLPAISAGQLMRYKVNTQNADGPTTAPSSADSMHYNGYTAVDSTITTNAPILQWFISDTDHDALITTGVDTNGRYPTVIAYGNQVYDNAQIRIRGNNTRGFPKHNFKIYLPAGYKIQIDGFTQLTDELDLNGDYYMQDISKVPTIWWVAKQSGLSVPDEAITRLQRNGQFEGLYNIFDKYSKDWRQANNFNHGTIYEELGVVTGAGSPSALTDWQNTELGLDNHDPAKKEYLLDNNNIPAMLNYMCFTALVHDSDQRFNRNSLQYFDNQTGRWSMLGWDQDGSFDSGGLKPLISPHDLDLGAEDAGQRFYATALYDQPDIRQLYLRRLRTVIDKVYSNDQIFTKYNQFSTTHAADIALDDAQWQSYLRTTKQDNLAAITLQKQTLLSYLNVPWAIPQSQTQSEQQAVQITEVNPDSSTANQYIKITNTASTPVDISGWTIDEISYSVPQGSVVPAGGYIYLLRNDLGYKSSHPAVLVAGEYANSLNVLTGHLTLKTGAGLEVDSFDY